MLPSPLEGEGRISNTRKLVLKFNPAVVGVHPVSEAHGKELNVLTSYRLNDFKKKIAFTLAEVLITLANDNSDAYCGLSKKSIENAVHTYVFSVKSGIRVNESK